jgi:hypothetical protein
MTLDDIAKQIDAMHVDVTAMRGELTDLKKTMDEGFVASGQRDDELGKTMAEGFDASRTRDEELRDLTKFGLEAREVLRDEMMRRFNDADRKHDEQIELLKTVVQRATD